MLSDNYIGDKHDLPAVTDTLFESDEDVGVMKE